MGASVPPLQGSPGGPTLVITPQTGAPIKSAVEQASDAARAAIQQTGTALPPEVVQRPGEPARVAPGVPEGGQFAPPLAREVPGGAPPPTGPAAPTAPPAPVPGAPAPVPPKPGDAPPAPVPPVVETVETPEQVAAREAEEALMVETPIMLGEGDAATPLVLHADTPENAAALQELVELAAQGRESASMLDSAQRQLQQSEEMQEYAAVDPVGFTINMLGNDIESGEVLAKFLLTQPTLFNRLKPTLQKMLATPAELTNVANEVKAKRGDLRDAASQRVAEVREVRQNVQDVQATVMSMIPSTVPEAQRKVAFRDMLRDLKDYADSQNLLTLPVHQIPSLLTDRLVSLGIDPEAAAAAAAVAAARRSGGSRGRPAIPVAGSRPALPAPAARAPVPKPNGKAFVTSAANRKAAAAIPPGGAGSPSGTTPMFSTRKEDGSVMSTEEAIAAHRARVARGIRSY